MAFGTLCSLFKTYFYFRVYLLTTFHYPNIVSIYPFWVRLHSVILVYRCGKVIFFSALKVNLDFYLRTCGRLYYLCDVTVTLVVSIIYFYLCLNCRVNFIKRLALFLQDLLVTVTIFFRRTFQVFIFPISLMCCLLIKAILAHFILNTVLFTTVVTCLNFSVSNLSRGYLAVAWNLSQVRVHRRFIICLKFFSIALTIWVVFFRMIVTRFRCLRSEFCIKVCVINIFLVTLGNYCFNLFYIVFCIFYKVFCIGSVCLTYAFNSC